MTDNERRYLIALAAEAASNPSVANAISADGYRKMMFAICEEMGVLPDPTIVVDDLLSDMNIRWLPRED